MVDAAAVIRSYAAEDRKLVQFMVGKSNMEALAVANNRTYFHPITLAVWFGLSAAFIQLMNWWPNQFGLWSYLRTLAGFATMAFPILSYIDWKNRPDFEKLTQEVARHQDLQNILRYYQDPASGVFIFEMGDTYIGFIAIDATQPAEKEDPEAPKTALVRHFHVEEKFRKTNAQKDLLEFAVSRAFNNDPELERIQATDSPLLTYQRTCLRAYGFELDHHTISIGLQKWKMGVRCLERESWSRNK